MESKIRILVLNLEKKNFVSLAHVNPKAYTTEPTSNVPGHVNSFFSSRWFIGIAFDQNALTTTNVDLTFEIQNFSQTGKFEQSQSALFFNSRKAIAGVINGLLLVFFYESKRSIGFFVRKYYSFRRRFDLKTKVGKIAV